MFDHRTVKIDRNPEVNCAIPIISKVGENEWNKWLTITNLYGNESDLSCCIQPVLLNYIRHY